MARSDPAVANGWWRRALFIRRTSNYAFRILTVLLPGYLRKNGAPYSGRAVVREYYDVFTVGSNDRRFTVTTIVEDPE